MATPSIDQCAADFAQNPRDTTAFFKLRHHYRTARKPAQLAALLEARAPYAGNESQVVELLWEAAHVYRDLGDETAEKRLVGRLLGRTRTHAQALMRGIELAEQAGQWDQVVDLWQARIENGTAFERDYICRSEIELGRLWATRFFRYDQALVHYQRALLASPSAAEALAAAKELYQQFGCYPIVARLLDIEVSELRGSLRAVPLLMTLATIQRDRLSDYAAAARTLERAISLKPSDRVLCEMLAELLCHPDWPPAEMGAAHTRAARLYYSLGTMAEEGGDLTRAIHFLRRTLGADPAHVEARTRLERAYQVMGHWPELERLYAQWQDTADTANVAALALRRAELLETKLGNREGAAACYRSILAQAEAGDPAFRDAQTLARESLRELYRKAGDPVAELALLAEAAAQTTPVADKVELLLQMAFLERDRLARPERAAALFHQVLKINPAHPEALAGYEQHFRNKGDYRQLARLLRFVVEAALSREPQLGAATKERCATWLRELAQIYDGQLAELPGALDAWKQVLKLYPDDLEAAKAISGLRERLDLLRDHVQDLRLRLETASAAGQRLEAMRRLAQVLFENSADPPQNISLLKEILAVAPRDARAEAMLISIYEREFDDQGLADMLQRKLRETDHAEDREKLLRRLGELFSDRLDRPQAAVAAYREVLELSPRDAGVMDKLEQLLELTADWANLAHLLHHRVAQVPEGAEDVLRRLARVYEAHLGDNAKAVCIWNEIAQRVPHDRESLAAVTRLHLERGGVGAEVELARVLRHRLDIDAQLTLSERVDLLRHLAGLLRADPAHPEKAIDVYEELAALLPGDRATLVELAALYGETGNGQAQLTVLERQAKIAEDGEAVTALALKRADLLEEKLGDSEGAIEVCWAALAQARPGDRDLLARLKALYQRLGDQARVIDLAERQALGLWLAGAPEVQRQEAALQIADRCRDLGNDQQTRLAYERLLAFDSVQSKALFWLYDYLLKTQQVAALLRLKPSLLSVLSADPARAQRVLIELGEICEHELSLFSEAFTAYREALSIDSDNAQVLTAAERVARTAGLMAELRHLFHEELARTADPVRRQHVLTSAADLCEYELRDMAAAFDYSLALFLLQADDPGVVERLWRLAPLVSAIPAPPAVEPGAHPARDPWQRWVQAYREVAGPATDQRVLRLRQIAHLWERGAGCIDQAFVALGEAAALDSDNDAVHQDLLSLADRTQQLSRLMETYQELIAHADDAHTFVVLELRAGRALRERGQLDAAAAYFEAALGVDPHQPEARHALAQVYRECGRWADLVHLYEHWVASDDPSLSTEERRQLLAQIADIHQDRLDDLPRAAAALAKYVACQPTDDVPLRRLVDLYRQTHAWPQVVQTAEALIDHLAQQETTATTRAEVVALYLAVGRVYERQLELPHRAMESYLDLLKIDPACDDAYDALERLYQTHGEPEKWVALLERRAAQEGREPSVRARLLFRLAQALEQRGELARATAHLFQARTLLLEAARAPDDELEEGLTRLLVAGDQVRDAVDLIKQQIARSQEAGDERVAALYVRLARVLSTQEGQRAACEAALHQALTRYPQSREALLLLSELKRQAHDWPAYAVLQRALTDALPPLSISEQLDALLHAAHVLREAGQTGLATGVCERALEVQPTALFALDMLLTLTQDDARRQEQLLRSRIELSTEPAEKARVLTELARLRAQRQTDDDGDRTAVVSLYEQALTLVPDHVPALLGLAQCYLDGGEADRALTVLQDAVAHFAEVANPPSDVGQLYLRLGELFDERQEIERGYEYFTQALHLRPNDLLVRIALGHNRFRAHRWVEALRYLRSPAGHSDAHKYPRIAADALYAAGQCEVMLRRADQADSHFEAALGIDPHHSPSLRELSDSAIAAGQIARGAEFLRRAAHAEPDPRRQLSLLRVTADLYWQKLGDRQRAADCFSELMERVGADDTTRLELFPHMIPLLREAGYQAAAARATDELAELLDNDDQRRQHWLAAARDYAAVGDWAQAANRWRNVLGSQPTRQEADEAVTGLVRRLREKEDPRGIVDLLEPHLRDLAPATDDAQRQTAVELFEMLAAAYQQLGDERGQIDALEGRLRLAEDMTARRTLAVLYEGRADDHDAALRNAQVLAQDLENTSSLRNLALAYQTTHPDRTACLYRVLKTIDQLNVDQQRFLERQTLLPLAPEALFPGTLSEEERDHQVFRADARARGELLSAIAWATPFLHPATPEQLGLQHSDRVSPIQDSYLAQVYAALGRAQAIKRTVLYHQQNAEEALRIVASSPVAVVIAERFVKAAPLAELRFCLARALELSRTPYFLAAGLRVEEFEDLYSEVQAIFQPRDSATRVPSRIDAAEAEAIKRKLPFKLSRRLHLLLKQAEDEGFDVTRWRRAVHLSANRVGLLYCGDLAVALDVVIGEEVAKRDRLPPRELLHKNDAVRDLLTFAVSEAYFVGREALGLAARG